MAPDSISTASLISATAGRNGTLAPSGKVAVFEGENKTFEIKPDAGYRIKNVEVNGRSVGPVNSYTFTDVRNDATIFATFEKETNTGITDSGTTTTAKDARQTQFDDVHSTDYYYDAVLWAVDKGITTGVSANRFEPSKMKRPRHKIPQALAHPHAAVEKEHGRSGGFRPVAGGKKDVRHQLLPV